MSRRALLRLGALAFSGAAAASELTKQSSCTSGGGALQLPSIGLGLWKAQPGEVAAAIKEAVKSGCRLLDGAAAYGNEPEVGRAIAEVIREGVVSREELWVVSKLFNTHHCWHGDCSRPAKGLAKTLKDLDLDSVDLYLMYRRKHSYSRRCARLHQNAARLQTPRPHGRHWPVAIEEEDLKPYGGLRLADGTPNPKLHIEFEYLDTWHEMIQFKKAGKVKHLGDLNPEVVFERR